MEAINTKQFLDLQDLFEQSTDIYADRVFSTHMGKDMTYAELRKHAYQFASILQHDCQINPGDRVAIMLPNLFQHHVALFGCVLAGAVVVCINPLYTSRELKHQLMDSGARLMIGLDLFGDVIETGIQSTMVDQVVLTSFGDMLGIKGTIANAWLRYLERKLPEFDLPDAKLFKSLQSIEYPPVKPIEDRHSERLAFLQYTGGTTGLSKGAMLSHANILANIEQCLSVSKYIETDDSAKRVLCALPMYHIYALTSICLLGLRRGDQLILSHNPRDINDLISTIVAHKPQVLPMINTLFTQLLKHPKLDSIDFSVVDYCLSGGMAQQKRVSDMWYEKTKTHIHQGYGLSETSPVVCIALTDDMPEDVGPPLPLTEIKILDSETGQWVEKGQDGEICVKGPQVMMGYWNRDDETKKVLDQGWLKTGDIGRLDSNGHLVICDRLKDMVIVNGYNVYPNEIESVLVQNDAIDEAAVVGMEDQSGQEYMVAYIIRSHDELSVRQVLDYCKENLVYYKVPRLISFVTELPKTAVGKVCRRKLKNTKAS